VTNEVIKILERKSAIVFDVAAETGGALEILNGFYDAAAKEKDIDWELILSTPIFSDADNIHVKNYFWIKKSWLHRLVFDKVIAPKLFRGKSIDVVVSLQNIAVSAGRKKQMLYLHQSIPFSDIELSIRNNRVEFIYKHLISHLIFHSIRKADQVVVQTKWMRDAVCKKTEWMHRKFWFLSRNASLTLILITRTAKRISARFSIPPPTSHIKTTKLFLRPS